MSRKPTHKLTVTAPDGTVFTRRTPRDYTHAVVCRGLSIAQRLVYARNSRASWQRHAEEYEAKIATGDPNHYFGGTSEVIGDYREYLRDAQKRIAEDTRKIAKLEQQQRDGVQDAYCNVTWHQRLDLAQKEQLKRSSTHTDPVIVEVSL